MTPDTVVGKRHTQFLLDLELRTNHLEEPAQLEQRVVDQLGAYLNLRRCYLGESQHSCPVAH